MARRLDEMAEDFGHEEGVPVGLAVEGMTELHPGFVHVVPGSSLHQRDDLVIGEARECQPGDTSFSGQRGQGFGERVRRGELDVPVGPDQEHAPPYVAREVTKELKGGRVGPVKVVDHHHDRLVGRGAFEKGRHRAVEDPALGGGVARSGFGEVRTSISQLRCEVREQGEAVVPDHGQHAIVDMGQVVAEELDEGSVGNWKVFVTPSVQDESPAYVGLPSKRGGESALADSGFAGDEDRSQELVGDDRLEDLL